MTDAGARGRLGAREPADGSPRGPTRIVADLRRPTPGGPGQGSWSNHALIELAGRDDFEFLVGALKRARGQRLLEVGCGNGFVALELARRGHDVTAIDPSKSAIAIARRTAATPRTSSFGQLEYVVTRFESWKGEAASFDAVLFNRSLHHLPRLGPALDAVRRLLTTGGRIVCNEYGYDRLDSATARWLYSLKRTLYLAGSYVDDPLSTSDSVKAVAKFQRRWMQEAKRERRHRFDALVSALQSKFAQRSLELMPYLFRALGEGLCNLTQAREHEIVELAKTLEADLIKSGAIQALGFRFVGRL